MKDYYSKLVQEYITTWAVLPGINLRRIEKVHHYNTAEIPMLMGRSKREDSTQLNKHITISKMVYCELINTVSISSKK